MKQKIEDSKIDISLVVPCYNEEEVISLFTIKATELLQQTELNYEIIFVNDGSSDKTLEKLIELKKSYSQIRILNLSRNFGKEAALTAGLEYAKGDCAIAIDADLQHPIELILEFIKKWKEGYDVVVGKRVTRTGEHPLKKVMAKLFYKFNNKISDIEIPADIGDFRLLDKKVLNALKLLPENQRFMKGLFAWVGFKTAVVEYEQKKREFGKSSFNGWKLWNFALDGITSFSTAPIRIWLYIGMIIAFLSFIYGSFIVIKTLIYGIDFPGYASLVTIMLFLGGIQLIGIGILGEYIGRIYKEAKRRPVYIIENEY